MALFLQLCVCVWVRACLYMCVFTVTLCPSKLIEASDSNILTYVSEEGCSVLPSGPSGETVMADFINHIPYLFLKRQGYDGERWRQPGLMQTVNVGLSLISLTACPFPSQGGRRARRRGGGEWQGRGQRKTNLAAIFQSKATSVSCLLLDCIYSIGRNQR